MEGANKIRMGRTGGRDWEGVEGVGVEGRKVGALGRNKQPGLM